MTILVEPPALPIPGTSRDPRQAALVAASDELERIGVPTERQTLLVAAGLRAGDRPASRRKPRHARVRAPLPRRARGARRRGPRPRRGRRPRERPAPRPPSARRDGRGRDGERRRDRPPRRAGHAPRGSGRRDRPRRDGRVAARDAHRARLGLWRSRSNGRLRACPADRRVADARPAPPVGHAARLPLRAGGGRADRRLACSRGRSASSPARSVRACCRRSGSRSPPRPRSPARPRSPTPRRSSAASTPSLRRCRAARRDLPRDPAHDAVPASRAAERTDRRLARPRLRAPALARRVPRAGRRNGDPRQPAPPPLLPPDAAAVPRFLQRRRGPAERPPRSPRRSARPPPTRARSTRIAAGAPAIPGSRSPTGSPAGRRSTGSGAVLVAGCRDAAAARQLGFVPTHGVPAALEMARGLAGGSPRIGFLLSPPYFPVRVGTG